MEQSKLIKISASIYRLVKSLATRFILTQRQGSELIKIAAIMTAPRHEITYARNKIEAVLKELQIPLTVSLGVFYGQCMQIMLEQLVESDCQYAVTIDFDSLFTAKQLTRLIALVVEHDHIDAIAPMQVRRGKLAMLGTSPLGVQVGDAKQIQWDGSPLLGTTAHFGLTVLDLKKLKGVPKPWFHATPDENGSWGPNKIDDDVSFWMAWKKAGNSVYFDPATRIGHLEEMVAIHDERMNARHIYPSDWEEQNAS